MPPQINGTPPVAGRPNDQFRQYADRLNQMGQFNRLQGMTPKMGQFQALQQSIGTPQTPTIPQPQAPQFDRTSQFSPFNPQFGANVQGFAQNALTQGMAPAQQALGQAQQSIPQMVPQMPQGFGQLGQNIQQMIPPRPQMPNFNPQQFTQGLMGGLPKAPTLNMQMPQPMGMPSLTAGDNGS